MAKFPFMKFYPADFIIDTQTLSLREEGAWIRLINHIWTQSKNGTIRLTDNQVMVLFQDEVANAFTRTGDGCIEEPLTHSLDLLQRLVDAGVFDYKVSLGNGEKIHTITSRRIARDKMELAKNAGYQRQYRVSRKVVCKGMRNEDSEPKVRDKKSEVRSQKTDKDNNKDSPAAPVRSSELSIVGQTKKAPHVDFVERFKASYQTITGQPFKDDRHHYIIAAALIKKHGVEQCVLKVKMLGSMCKNRSAWFTKEGWADFSLEKLSSQWNAIIPSHTQSQEEKELETWKEESRKARELSERTNATINRG